MAVRTGRLSRLARLGGMAASLAGGAAGAIGRGAVRGRDEAVARFHRDSAERLLRVLGEMKGLPQKVGQILSILDDAIPTEYRDIYRETLGQLQEHADPLPWSELRPVVEAELAGSVDEFFRQVDAHPVASASIGQVHRGHLLDGRPVALKVQYPGIAAALDADLDNVGALVAALSAVLPGTDVAHLVADVTSRFREELRYDLEQQAQQACAERWAGDPDVLVPATVPTLCTPHLLVSEWVPGLDWSSACASDATLRDAWGAALWRFTWHGVLQHRWVHGDPHPGNFRFLADGRVAVLDFGCTAALPDCLVVGLGRFGAGVLRGAPDAELVAALVQALGLPVDLDPELAAIWLSFARRLMEPVASAQPYVFHNDFTRQLMEQAADAKLAMARRALWTGVPTPTTSGAVLLMRTTVGLSVVLAKLGSRADFRRASGL